MVGIDQGSPSVLALSNRIRREAIGLKDIGLPLDAFPQKLQGISPILSSLIWNTWR